MILENNVNCLYCLLEVHMHTQLSGWSLGQAIMRLYHVLVDHHAIEVPGHVGAFAGSLLERRDWDHN
jgi:hypothetical protein